MMSLFTSSPLNGEDRGEGDPASLTAPLSNLSPSRGKLGTESVLLYLNFESPPYQRCGLPIIAESNEASTAEPPRRPRATARFMIVSDVKRGRNHRLTPPSRFSHLRTRLPIPAVSFHR